MNEDLKLLQARMTIRAQNAVALSKQVVPLSICNTCGSLVMGAYIDGLTKHTLSVPEEVSYDIKRYA